MNVDPKKIDPAMLKVLVEGAQKHVKMSYTPRSEAERAAFQAIREHDEFIEEFERLYPPFQSN